MSSVDGEPPRLLSHEGSVLAFRLCVGSAAEGAPRAQLQARRMLLHPGSRAFALQASVACSTPGRTSSCKILLCSCVSDCRTGLRLPCVLLRCTGDGLSTYELLCLQGTQTFEKRLSVTPGHDLEEHGLRVLNGPALLWQHHQTFFWMAAQTRGAVSLPVNFASVVWAGELDGLGRVLLGMRELHSPEKGCTPRLSVSGDEIGDTRLCAYSLERREVLGGEHIPPAYSRVLSCVHVCAAQVTGHRLSMSLLVLTKRNQLISFENGSPSRICQLPCEDPCALQVLDSHRGNSFYVVSFRTHEACAVSGKTFQTVAKWGNLGSVLIDDFVGAGWDQALLLCKDAFGSSSLTPFKITDLGRINYSSEALDSPEHDGLKDQSDSNSLGVLLLEKTLKACWGSIQELQWHLSLKDKIMVKSWKVLVHKTQDQGSSPPRPEEGGLVPFCGGEENRGQTCEEKLADNHLGGPKHRIGKTWFRVIDDHLVVGVKIASSVTLSLSDVTLALKMDTAHGSSFLLVKCGNRLVKLNTASCLAPPERPPEEDSKARSFKVSPAGKEGGGPAWEQPPREEHAYMIVGETSLSPLLVVEKLCGTLLLEIRGGETGQPGRDGCVQHHQLWLSPEGFSREQYLPMFPEEGRVEQVEDLCARLAVFSKSRFRVSCPGSSLSSMKAWLLGPMTCKVTQELPEVYFCEEPGGFYGTLFSWKPETTSEGVLAVYSRSAAALLQCLRHLARMLPGHCVFKTLKAGSEAFPPDRLASTLEEELVALGPLSWPVSPGRVGSSPGQTGETSQGNGNVSALLDSEGKMHLHRREIQAAQKMLEMNAEVSGALYREMTLKLAEIQLTSDLMAQKLDYS